MALIENLFFYHFSPGKNNKNDTGYLPPFWGHFLKVLCDLSPQGEIRAHYGKVGRPYNNGNKAIPHVGKDNKWWGQQGTLFFVPSCLLHLFVQSVVLCGDWTSGTTR